MTDALVKLSDVILSQCKTIDYLLEVIDRQRMENDELIKALATEPPAIPDTDLDEAATLD